MLDAHVCVRARAAVLTGPMGVGKSRLLAAWATAWEAQGGETIVIRATRATATVPFGAFAGWVPARLGGAADRLAVLQATAASLTSAGGREGVRTDRPPVVVVDDAHLLDEGSAALVLHLVEHTSLGVLVTVRSGEPCSDAVAALWKEGLATRFDLAPLSEARTAELLEQLLEGPVAPATRRRIWHLTQGNPLYIHEVLEAARAPGGFVSGMSLSRGSRAGGAPGDGAWQWEGGLRGRRLAELVSERVGGVGSEGRRVLDLVALGEPLPVAVLARLAPGDVLAQVERQGLVAVDRPAPDRAGGPTTRLAHPLYAEVLRAELPAFTAASLCASLAEAALATGMDEYDPLRVATWLLEAGGEPTRPDLLLRASLGARIVDDYESSVRFAEAAERAGGGWRATLRRAIALGPLGRLGEADALLASLSRPGVEPEARAAAADVRAEQSFWHRREPLAVARAILAEAAGAVPRPWRSWLLSFEAQMAITGLHLDDAVRLAGEAYTEAGSVVDRLHAITTAALAAAYRGQSGVASTAVELTAAEALKVMDDEPLAALNAALAYSFASVLAGRSPQAGAVFQDVVDQHVASGKGPPHALPVLWCARAAQAQGDVARAGQLCRQAKAHMGDENHYGRGTWVVQTLATAAAQCGDVETAVEALRWMDAHPHPPVGAADCATDLARAWVTSAQGRSSAARAIAITAARRAAGAGAWGVEAATLVDVVRLGGAAVVAPRLAELAGLVDGPYVVAAARLAGAAAAGDGDGLDDAAARFAAMGARLHAAEAATLAAEAHGSAGLRGRRLASLSAAQRLAAGCPGAATPLLARLDQVPLATTLTDRQREVAELAARGRTSREIARALSISVRTVHSHLNHAYAKLGTNDRDELGSVLGLLGTGREADQQHGNGPGHGAG